MADDEDVAKLKEWWKEYGRTVVVGVVLGLGGIVGWNGWQSYQERRAEEASEIYAQVVEAAGQGRHADARNRAALLVAEYPRSGYATLAAFVASASAAAQGEPAEARNRLSWIAENASREGFRDLARIRLARVLLDEKDAEAALDTLGKVGSDAFDAVAGELRGDIHLARGAADEARDSWRKVLDGEAALPSSRVRVRMKLDDLGHLRVP